jgi:hypothetical protein
MGQVSGLIGSDVVTWSGGTDNNFLAGEDYHSAEGIDFVLVDNS